MKIYYHPERQPWIIDRIGKEFQDFSKNEVKLTFTQSEIFGFDLVWLGDSNSWRMITPDEEELIKFYLETPVVCTIHHIVPWKWNEQKYVEFMTRDYFVDVYHVPCQQTHDIIRSLTEKPIKILGYWVNSDLWKYREREEIRKKYESLFNISSDKFVVGSFQRDTEGHDLESPKLEKGPDIFCGYVEKLVEEGKDVHVLLNGHRRQYVINRLEGNGIPHTYVEMPPMPMVSEMYSACDLYVVGSRVEGGPQSILECAISKIPIVSTDVGIASKVLPKSCILDMNMRKEYDTYMPTQEDIDIAFNNAQSLILKDHVKNYDDFFEEVLRMK